MQKILKKNEYNLKNYDEARYFYLQALIQKYQNQREQALRTIEKGIKINSKFLLLVALQK